MRESSAAPSIERRHDRAAGEDGNPERSVLALVHTVTSLVTEFETLANEVLGDAPRFNIVDETLLRDASKPAGLTAQLHRRVLRQLEAAEAGEADLILVTCSSIGPAVDAARPFVSVPLLRVDEPMVDEAVRRASRIGVIATLRSTLEPTTALLSRASVAAGRETSIVPYLVEGAFDARRRGDLADHDERIRAAATALAESVDLLLLAQASMARVLAGPLPSMRSLPVLSSPRLAMERVATLLVRKREGVLRDR